MNDLTSTATKQSVRPVDRAQAGPLGWLRGEIDRLFDDFSFARPPRSAFNFPVQFDVLRPVTDLRDQGAAYRLSVELPGMRHEDINVEFRGGDDASRHPPFAPAGRSPTIDVGAQGSCY